MLAENGGVGRALRVEHWGEALAHGEVAGRTAAGEAATWDGVPGFWSTIGSRTLKYAAWGDGYDEASCRPHADGGFTVAYRREGQPVGVLTHRADDDYERGRAAIALTAMSARASGSRSAGLLGDVVQLDVRAPPRSMQTRFVLLPGGRFSSSILIAMPSVQPS